MYIHHIALGGCLTAPHVNYGLTEDTGGHIAYILGAAEAQARRPDVDRVDIVTRAFDDPNLGAIHRERIQIIGPRLRIIRLATGNSAYLSKEALAAEIPALTEAYLALLGEMDVRPDVIHAHFADASRLARAAAARFGATTCYTPHSLGIDKKRLGGGKGNAILEARIAEETEALRGSDVVVVSSRDEAERQVEGYGVDVSGRVHRVPPGTPQGFQDPGAGTEAAEALVGPLLDAPDRPMILAVARPVARKNLVGLMNAYVNDAELHAAANLVVLAGQDGNGAEESRESRQVIDELRAIAAGSGLAGKIALPPRHSFGVVPQLYRLAAARGGVFVNPALHEPFGLTLLEAAQAGLPVVATREGGPADIVGSIGHGILVDPRDSAAIGKAIRDLIFDPAEWRRASGRGTEGARAFDWDIWAARVCRICRDVRAAAPRPVEAGRTLLACDIDGTLTGDRDAARRFSDWAIRRAREGVTLAVATGRSISEARAVLLDWDLPEPDLFITAVGTEIHYRGSDGRFALCPRFARHLDGRWSRSEALRFLEGSGLQMQPDVEQRRWKLAAFGSAEEADALRVGYARAGLDVHVVASHGRLIDILAPDGGKASAIAFAAGRYGLTLRDCIAAGDSGNDADMLVRCGSGILVANALPEVSRLKGAPRLRRSRHRHAAGVLDGLRALGFDKVADRAAGAPQ